MKVVAPIDDTPAAKAGVMANDLIIKLDDEQVHNLAQSGRSKMRSPANRKIPLIMRKGQDKPIDVTIVRERDQVKASVLSTGAKSW